MAQQLDLLKSPKSSSPSWNKDVTLQEYSYSTEHKTRFTGAVIPRQEVSVSDNPNSVKLISYGNDAETLSAGKSYILKNVRLNSYNKNIYINTTSERIFAFVGTEKIDAVDVSTSSEISIMAKIIGISSINMHYFCILCNPKLVGVYDPDDECDICISRSSPVCVDPQVTCYGYVKQSFIMPTFCWTSNSKFAK